MIVFKLNKLNIVGLTFTLFYLFSIYFSCYIIDRLYYLFMSTDYFFCYFANHRYYRENKLNLNSYDPSFQTLSLTSGHPLLYTPSLNSTMLDRGYRRSQQNTQPFLVRRSTKTLCGSIIIMSVSCVGLHNAMPTRPTWTWNERMNDNEQVGGIGQYASDRHSVFRRYNAKFHLNKLYPFFTYRSTTRQLIC